MKELDEIVVLQKGLGASIEGLLCVTKEHLDNSEGQVEVESPLTRNIFDKFHLY